MLTKELVIAIAAAVFILFNLIMWTIVIRKNKKAKPPEAPSGGRGSSPTARLDASSALTLDDEEGGEAPKEPRKLPEDFVIEENIVWVHTNEKL